MDRRQVISSFAAASAASMTSTKGADRAAANTNPIDISTSSIRVSRSFCNRMYQFVPESTALLVIDMQRHFFFKKNNEYLTNLANVIPNVVQLVEIARSIGCKIIYTRESYRPDLADVSPYRQWLGYIGRQSDLGPDLVRGSPGHQLIPEITMRNKDVVIDKPGFSAFYQSNLQEVLSHNQITHLIFCGITTQCCVHSTLRDAVDRGYWCLTVADCCAAHELKDHQATLELIQSEGNLFGWITKLDDLRSNKSLYDYMQVPLRRKPGSL